MQKVVILNIRLWQLLSISLLYVFFCGMYILTTNFTINQWAHKEIAIDYILKGIFTLVIYWVIFFLGKHWKLYVRLTLHLLTLPLFLSCWLISYHFILDQLGSKYLSGPEIWWDVFISLMFYSLQFGIFHAYEYYTRYIAELQRNNRIKELTLKAELNGLRAQIQPHFLFNALNSISASLPKNLEGSRELIAGLADLFRFALKATEQNSITIHEELQFIKTYLSFEQRRFPDTLSIRYDIEEKIINYQVPPMLLQPIVENAIKHGVQQSINPVQLTLRIQDKGENVLFSVEDTGNMIVGQNPEFFYSKGVGLSNTRKRLEIEFGTTLLIRSNTPTGWIVSFYLPKNRIYGVETSDN